MKYGKPEALTHNSALEAIKTEVQSKDLYVIPDRDQTCPMLSAGAYEADE